MPARVKGQTPFCTIAIDLACFTMLRMSSYLNQLSCITLNHPDGECGVHALDVLANEIILALWTENVGGPVVGVEALEHGQAADLRLIVRRAMMMVTIDGGDVQLLSKKRTAHGTG